MIAIGILYQWQLLLSLNDEYMVSLTKVRALLRELQKGKYAAGRVKGEQGHAEEEEASADQ